MSVDEGGGNKRGTIACRCAVMDSLRWERVCSKSRDVKIDPADAALASDLGQVIFHFLDLSDLMVKWSGERE